MKSSVVFMAVFLTFTTSVLAGSGQDSDLPEGIRSLTVSGLYYLSYQSGEKSGADFSKFAVKRGYLTVKKGINDFLASRITMDAHQDNTGDMKVRIKYLYADIKFPEFAFVTKPHMEFGLVHTPWLDFEEHINYYRMQDTMFMERVGIFNSGDFGFIFLGYLAGDMDKDYRKRVNNKYPGRYGSFAVGMYNGGGYHAQESNLDKTAQARLTIRPLPDVVPGLQVSGLTIMGEGNQSGTVDATNDWQTTAAMLSYEHRYLTFTGQYVAGHGNKSGGWSEDADYRGYSLFAEGKLGPNWRIIGRLDYFDPNTDASDNEYNRVIGGVGYDFGHHNILLLDYDHVTYQAPGASDDDRIQLTFQIHY